jgi:hypothetical protein
LAATVIMIVLNGVLALTVSRPWALVGRLFAD